MKLIHWNKLNFLAWCAEWHRHWLIAICGSLVGLILRLMTYKMGALDQPQRPVLPAIKLMLSHPILGSIFSMAFLIWALGDFQNPHKRPVVFIISLFIAIFLANLVSGLFTSLSPTLSW